MNYSTDRYLRAQLKIMDSGIDHNWNNIRQAMPHFTILEHWSHLEIE